MTELLCPFCDGVLDEELYNSTYGCDTGCDYVRIEIRCPHCEKVTWDSGEFGYLDYDDAEDRADYLNEFRKEFHAEMLRLHGERKATS